MIFTCFHIWKTIFKAWKIKFLQTGYLYMIQSGSWLFWPCFLVASCYCSWWKDTICFPSIEHRWLIEALLEIFFFLVTTLFQRSDSNRFTCCTPVWVVSSGDGSPPFLLQVGVIFYLFCYRLWWRMVKDLSYLVVKVWNAMECLSGLSRRRFWWTSHLLILLQVER